MRRYPTLVPKERSLDMEVMEPGRKATNNRERTAMRLPFSLVFVPCRPPSAVTVRSVQCPYGVRFSGWAAITYPTHLDPPALHTMSAA